ncbi:MAG: hypothetical protein U1C96_04820 [Gallionella sp.]|nr:hypothetical protein [Gallionella sp.]
MAIKQQHPLTKEDFEAALVSQRLSISEVSRETGIPRHIVSHFRNYGDGMKPEQLAKLRDYLEDLGVEFTDEEKTPSRAVAPGINSLNPQLSVGLKVEHYFPISNSISDEVVREAMYIMEENDARLVALLQTKLEHKEGFFSDGDLTDETKATLQETFALLASNYITFRMLRGWRALNVEPATDKPETVRDMVLQTFMQPLIDAGLIAAPQVAEKDHDEASEKDEVEA